MACRLFLRYCSTVPSQIAAHFYAGFDQILVVPVPKLELVTVITDLQFVYVKVSALDIFFFQSAAAYPIIKNLSSILEYGNLVSLS